jgi:hypothetical protein
MNGVCRGNYCAVVTRWFAVRRVWAIALLLLDKVAAKVASSLSMCLPDTNNSHFNLQEVEAASWSDLRRCVAGALRLICAWSCVLSPACRHIHLNETHAGAGSIFTQLKVTFHCMLLPVCGACSCIQAVAHTAAC